jgi:hypothetical protein
VGIDFAFDPRDYSPGHDFTQLPRVQRGVSRRLPTTDETEFANGNILPTH